MRENFNKSVRRDRNKMRRAITSACNRVLHNLTVQDQVSIPFRVRCQKYDKCVCPQYISTCVAVSSGAKSVNILCIFINMREKQLFLGPVLFQLKNSCWELVFFHCDITMGLMLAMVMAMVPPWWSTTNCCRETL